MEEEEGGRGEEQAERERGAEEESMVVREPCCFSNSARDFWNS
jgi:hypothetical protein